MITGEVLNGLVYELKHLRHAVSLLTGEHHRVVLKNREAYPFNNSKITVALNRIWENGEYLVLVQVVRSVGGDVGQIHVTDKMRNGFQLAYTGSAKEVTLDLRILN